jgi:hypothetical protein
MFSSDCYMLFWFAIQYKRNVFGFKHMGLIMIMISYEGLLRFILVLIIITRVQRLECECLIVILTILSIVFAELCHMPTATDQQGSTG